MTDVSDRKTPFREKGRVKVAWKATINPPEPEGRPVEAMLTDLGMGGASLSSPVAWPAGTTLTLEIPTGDCGSLVLPGTVRWTDESSGSGNPARIGVTFEGLSPNQTARLAELLSTVPQIRDLGD